MLLTERAKYKSLRQEVSHLETAVTEHQLIAETIPNRAPLPETNQMMKIHRKCKGGRHRHALCDSLRDVHLHGCGAIW